MTNVLRSRATTRDVRIRASILTNGKRGARNGSHCWASCRRGPLAHGHPITRNGIALTTFSLAPSSLPSCRFCPSARCPNTIYITPTLRPRPDTHFLFSIFPSRPAPAGALPPCPLFLHAALSDDCLHWVRHPAWRPPFISRSLDLDGVADRPTGSFAFGNGLAFPLLPVGEPESFIFTSGCGCLSSRGGRLFQPSLLSPNTCSTFCFMRAATDARPEMPCLPWFASRDGREAWRPVSTP